MKKYSVSVLSIFFFLSMFLFSTDSYGEARLAIVDFENRTSRGGWRIGRGAADILTTHLVKETNFDVFERDRLTSVMKEQNLGESGRLDAGSAAKLGKIIGVQYIVTGAVTEYGQSRSGGGGGGVRVGKRGYSASVDVRIVDAETSQVVFAETGSGAKASVNVKVFGIGGGEKWNEKKATEVMRLAIEDVAKKMATAKLSAKVAAKAPPKSILIADVDGALITLNQGQNAGLKNGDVLFIKRQSKVIKDPATGDVIRVKYATLGKVELTDVGGSYAEAKIVEGSGFNLGDKAERN